MPVMPASCHLPPGRRWGSLLLAASAAVLALIVPRMEEARPCGDKMSWPQRGPFSICRTLRSYKLCHRPHMRTACSCSCDAAQNDDGGGGLWWVRGEAYALGPFVARHPGGSRYLLNSVDTDITYLFESHHINGTRARSALERYRVTPTPTHPNASAVEAVHKLWSAYVALTQGSLTRGTMSKAAGGDPTHVPPLLESARYAALKKEVAESHDLAALKEATLEYHAVQLLTVLLFVCLLVVCLRPTTPAVQAWAAHAGLGIVITWLGAMAHNGLHLWPRRLEALFMFLWFESPFVWMYGHLQSHHMHTNTAFDLDMLIVDGFNGLWRNGRTLTFALAPAFGFPSQGFKHAFDEGYWTAYPEGVSRMLERLGMPLTLAAVLCLGLARQGPRRWLPRHLLTAVLTSSYGLIMFETSHVQTTAALLCSNHTLQQPAMHPPVHGDAIYDATDDWGEFQLRTTLGWASMAGAAASLPSLFLNLQPAHHLFPAVHHSQLYLLVPLIRKHYPCLMEDHDFWELLAGALRTLASSPR